MGNIDKEIEKVEFSIKYMKFMTNSYYGKGYQNNSNIVNQYKVLKNNYIKLVNKRDRINKLKRILTDNQPSVKIH